MKVYRINDHGKLVGVIAADSEEAANAYALGAYGAGAEATPVAIKQALSGSPVCIIASTKEVLASACNPTAKLRVLV